MKKYIAGIVCVLIITWYISAHFYQLMMIQGDSMSPSFHNLQIVLLNKYEKTYVCGDVIAFRCEGLKAVLVKRIVAVPGDTVYISGGRLYVNGIASILFSKEDAISYAGIAADEITLQEGQYFVMGDNYEQSKDSRYEVVGFVKYEDIVGKVSE